MGKFFKIVLLGANKAGKTTLLYRFVDNLYNENYPTTIGAEYLQKDILFANEKNTLAIFDMGSGDGPDGMNAYTKEVLGKNTDAICLLVNISPSNKNIEGDLADACKDLKYFFASAGKKINLWLVGTNLDTLSTIQFTREREAYLSQINEIFKKFKSEIEKSYHEAIVNSFALVSSKTGQGVNELILNVAKSCLDSSSLIVEGAKQLDFSAGKSYFLIPKENRNIEAKKESALVELKTDLNNATSFREVGCIFSKIKQPNILRYQEGYILRRGYVDTESYKSAIQSIFNHTLRLLPTTKFDEFRQVMEIHEEARRFLLLEQNKDYIASYKREALSALTRELSYQSDLSGVIEQYQQLKEPNNLLTIHRENIIRKVGATASYRKALLEIAKVAIKFDLPNNLEQAELFFDDLIQEMERYKPKGNLEEWSDALSRLKDSKENIKKKQNIPGLIIPLNNLYLK